MSEVSQHDIEDMSMKPEACPKAEVKALHVAYTGDDILRIMKQAKASGVKRFSCNGLVFDFV